MLRKVTRNRKQKSGMADIAAAAGVSIMTVSRALREPERVSSETQKKIEQAIRKLNYVPDMIASSMRTNQTGVVSLLVPTLRNSFFAAFIDGVSDTLAKRNYQLMIGAYNYDAKTEERLISACIGRRTDGVIIAGIDHSAATRQMLKRAGLPVVETWDLSSKVIDSQVGFSNALVGTKLAEYLIGKGYRRVAFAGSSEISSRLLKRESGFMQAFEAAGLPPPLVRKTPGYDEIRAGRELVTELLQVTPNIEAIAFRNDAMAAGALFECQRRGIPVPERVAIMGFGDFEIASEIHPSLTTMRIPNYDIGVKATEVLLARLAGEPSQCIDVGFEIVARQSA